MDTFTSVLWRLAGVEEEEEEEKKKKNKKKNRTRFLKPIGI